MWISNEIYKLAQEDENIFFFFNSCWMILFMHDVKLSLHALGNLDASHFVLNCQKKDLMYLAVPNDRIFNLCYNWYCRRLLSFEAKVCNCWRKNLTAVWKRLLSSLYTTLLITSKFNVRFLPVQKQTDKFNGGLFTVEYAAQL